MPKISSLDSSDLIDRLQRWTKYFTLAVVIVNLLAVVYASNKLRPGADDYCYGLVAGQFGLIGGAVHWWNTWNGFAFPMLLGNIFVGVPLAQMPLKFASAIPFLVTALMVGLTVLAMAPQLWRGKSMKWLLIPLMAFLWWSFLWANASLGGTLLANPPIASNEVMLLAQGLTHWQTLNSTYVCVILAVLLGGGWLINRSQQANLLSYGLFFLLGLIAGTAHITMALSILAFGFSVFVGSRFLGMPLSRTHTLQALYFLAAVLIAMCICHFLSPGAQLRKGLLGAPFAFTIFNVVNLFYFVVSFSFKLWVLSFWNVGALLVLLITTSFFFIRADLITQERAKRLLLLGASLAVFALIQILVSRFSEAFTYVAYWHYVNPLVCIFLAIFFSAISLAYWLSALSQDLIYRLVASAVLIGTLMLGLSTNIFMVEAIYLRETSWALGAAPTEGVTDIEDAKGWQMDCWNKLNQLRPTATMRQSVQK
jgi:hypothetical protein